MRARTIRRVRRDRRKISRVRVGVGAVVTEKSAVVGDGRRIRRWGDAVNMAMNLGVLRQPRAVSKVSVVAVQAEDWS